VANTDDQQEMEQGKQPVQVLIRIWQARSNVHSQGNSDASASARMLVEDVLSSTLEATTYRRREDCVYASGISNLSRTLAASRAVQEAFGGFRAAVPLARTTVSVVIDRPNSSESGTTLSGPSVELTSLLDAANPGQVLITQSFYKSVGSGQALDLRSFPTRAGAYEWLWTSEERLAQLRSDPYFQRTLVGEPRTELKGALTAPTYPASTVHLRTQQVEKPEARSDKFHIGNLSPLHKISAALALAVAVTVGAGTWWYMRPISRSNQVGRRGPRVVSPKGLETEPFLLGPQANIPLSDIHPFIPNLQLQSRTPVRPGCSIADQIPRYVVMAESSRNRGQCDDAIRQYKGVLACEPGNREARQGLERVLQDKRFNLCR
jgi:hypothetical protein